MTRIRLVIRLLITCKKKESIRVTIPGIITLKEAYPDGDLDLHLHDLIDISNQPSKAQSRRILYGINNIGQELAEMSVIYERTKDEK